MDKLQGVISVEHQVVASVSDTSRAEEAKYKALGYDAYPVILHLDPIKAGGHDTHVVGSALKQWLRRASVSS